MSFVRMLLDLFGLEIPGHRESIRAALSIVCFGLEKDGETTLEPLTWSYKRINVIASKNDAVYFNHYVFNMTLAFESRFRFWK